MKNERHTNFELLRIFCMIAVIAYHYSVYIPFSIYGTFTVAGVLLFALQFLCRTALDIFIMISGYFLVNSKMGNYKKKMLMLFSEMLCYSFVFTLLNQFTKIIPGGKFDLIRAMMPVSRQIWWFASTYFVMYLLHPFLNIGLLAFSKRECQKLLITIVVFWSILPQILVCGFERNNLLWFLSLYCIGAYIKLYGLCPKIKKRHYMLLMILSVIFTMTTIVVLLFLKTNYRFELIEPNYFVGMTSFNVLIMAVSIFMLFRNVKIESRFINKIASASFGVYLIHENGYVRELLWKKWFVKLGIICNPFLIIMCGIGIAFLVYGVCMLIDFIRQLIFANVLKLIMMKQNLPDNQKSTDYPPQAL